MCLPGVLFSTDEQEDADDMELVGVVGAEEREPLSLRPAGLVRPVWGVTGTSWQQVHMQE